MASRLKELDEDVERDVRGSYAAVAHSGRDTGCGILQKLARAFLKWDSTASKAARKDLQNFADMPLTMENVTWMTERSFIDSFRRALVDSAQHDDRGGEYLDEEAGTAAPDNPGRLLGQLERRRQHGADRRRHRSRDQWQETKEAEDFR